MTKHYTEEGGSCVLGKIMSFSELVKKDLPPKPDKPFYVTTKTKNLVIEAIGLDQFKDEVRRGGFDIIHVMDDITGPIKEEIWL